ncbi:MAG: SRPBCC family protein [Gemmatimonas sp.]
MSTTRVTRHINAPRARVYATLIDAAAIAQWKVPDGMTAEVHNFDAREGGKFRISLTYESPDHQGKTSSHTDTYHGYFRELVPDEKVVEIDVFETDDPTMQGEMTITITLEDANGGTLLTAVHEGLPDGVKPEDNEYGWSMSLGKLATLLERGS